MGTAFQQRYNLDHIPTLFVATKSDLDLAQQVRFSAFVCDDTPRVTDWGTASDMRSNLMFTADG